MLCRVVLWCVVVSCVVLCCGVSCCAFLYWFGLCCLCWFVLVSCIVLRCVVLCCDVLCCAVLRWRVILGAFVRDVRVCFVRFKCVVFVVGVCMFCLCVWL